MKNFIAVALLLAFSVTAEANGPWYRAPQDYKFPTQAAQEHMLWVTPLLGLTTAAFAAMAPGTSTLNMGVTTTFTNFKTQPDFPRNVVLTPTGSTGAIASGTAVVTGTNIFGKTITENFAITAAQNTATTGNSAFKSITSIVFPAVTPGGGNFEQLAVGYGSKLGMTRCTKHAGDYDFSEIGGVFETTRGTMGSSSTLVEANTFSPNGAMDGTKDVDLFYVQNFVCYGN